MEKYRAIPEGYMRIGELAKKAGITTRTLRYYDKGGLLSPSQESEGGYRLYSDKDLVKLIQILMMKRLGFPLGEIKKRMAAMDTAGEVVGVLTEQATKIRREIEHMTESLNALESLKDEIVQMDCVDFKKFAIILEGIHMKSERYWIVKYLDNDVLDMLTDENAPGFANLMDNFIIEAAALQEEGIPPGGEKGQDFAARFWKTMMEFTGGDMSLVYKISGQFEKSKTDEKHDETMKKSYQFMLSALEAYFNFGFFEEAAELQENNALPESAQAQDLAERFWRWLMELTGGDMAVLQSMNEQFMKSPSDKITKETHHFMESALGIYLNKSGGNT
ncbi:MAG: MerR family transcriptional regulator [Oscillospiraceae bacterium]|nr:MerR family transcriptional regulator [Oscillospiraceae bacterium]